jgi:hypothetical protein
MRLPVKNISLIILLLLVLSDPLLSQPSIYSIEKMPFNSSFFNDIAPVILKDGIIFCSDRRLNSFSNNTTYQDYRLYNLYFVERKDSSGWRRPEEIKSPGSDMLYYGPVCIAPNGKTIYFTSSIISGKAARQKDIINPCGIFIGELSGTDIINIQPFEFNNISYNVAHPSISRDGKFLFFASDMPGGQGESDLYYCENINGVWGSPVNLGSNVNSPSRENYPFIHSSGRLYFTSNRPGNSSYMGGMDVYYTSLNDGQWETPVPMPSPINSQSDDFAFVAADNLRTGYFSRNTGRDDDIWSYTSNIIRKSVCDTLQKNSYCYEFLEENAIKYDTMPVPFRYEWNFGDGSSAEGARTIHCYEGPGDYRIHLDVINLITNEIETNEKTYDLEVPQIEQPYISGPDHCSSGQEIKFSADSTYLPSWTITQFYWNFGDETIEIGKDVDKTYLRPGVYNIQLIVTGSPGADGIAKEVCVSKDIVVRQP